MRLEENPLLPMGADTDYTRRLEQTLWRLFSEISTKVNGLADGRLSQIDNALTSAPTTGTWAQGDFVRNSAPTEQGSASSKYVVYGWLNVAGGAPGTWVQCRFLTGN